MTPNPPYRRRHRACATALVATLTASGFACDAPGAAARRVTVAPDYAAESGQSRCSIAASSSKPLVVEWPAADRASLEARAGRGAVVVRYSGCELEILPACAAKTSYGWLALTPKREVVRIADADDLYANLPIGAAKLEGKLARSGELTVDMVIIGRKEASQQSFTSADLEGQCSGATHVISALTVGAFSFYAGAGAELGAGVEVGGAGIGASSSHRREVLSQDGAHDRCDTGTPSSDGPPLGCGALLRIEVAAIDGPSIRGGIPPALPAELDRMPDRTRAGRAHPKALITAGAVTGGVGIALLGAMAGGLAMSTAAQRDIAEADPGDPSTSSAEARGLRGNALAAGAGVSAAVALAVAIPLLVVGAKRRRAAR